MSGGNFPLAGLAPRPNPSVRPGANPDPGRVVPDHGSGPVQYVSPSLVANQAQPVDPPAYPHVPPPRVSSDPNHPDYHPSCRRIGVMVDGVRKTDCCWYDAPGGFWRSIDAPKGHPRPGQVVVFWLWTESRQERRARERWDAKHGKG